MADQLLTDVRHYSWASALRECARPLSETALAPFQMASSSERAVGIMGREWDLGLGWEETKALALGTLEWKDGRREIEQRAREQATRNLRKLPALDYGYDVEGQWFDVSAVVEGRPEQWMTPQWGMVGERASVKLIIDLSTSAACSAQEMCERMYSVASVALTIERAGIAVEVIVVTVAVEDGPGFALSMQVNKAGEPLDVSRVIAAAHPAFFRRVMFRLIEMTPLEACAKAYHNTYGHVLPLTPESVKRLYGPHAYYLPGLHRGIGLGPTIAALNDILTTRGLHVAALPTVGEREEV